MRVIIGAIAAGALALSMSVPTAVFAQTPSATPPPSSASVGPRTLVVPFENARNEPRFHWLGEASAVLLTDALRATGAALIVRSERVRAFEQLNLPLSAALSRATIIKVGHLSGAADVIVGSYRVEGTTLSVTARGIRLDAGRLQPEVTERGDLQELFAIFDRLAARLGGGTRAQTPVPHPPLDAFENYIKGLLAENPVSQTTFLESALRDAPSFDRARLALWDALTEQADHIAALDAVRAVPAASPLSFRARFSAGISLIELKRYDEAMSLLKSLLEPARTPSQTAAVLNNLGVLAVRRGATPEGGSGAYYFTKATDAEPDPDYMFNLGFAYAVDKNYQGALYWLREALRRDPTDVDAHYVLAIALQATGSGVESVRERELARQLSSRYEELERRAVEQRVQVPSGMERLRLDPESSGAMAIDRTIASPAQREQRELATFHLEQGRKYFEREQDRDALSELRKAVYLSPYEAQAHLLIGRIYLRAGRPTDAVDALKISIWSEDRAPAHVYLAEAFLKLGDHANARAEAQKALALDPASEDAKRLLALIK